MKTQIKPETLQDYLNLKYPITLYPDLDGGYTVMLADLPGCISQGDTLEESVLRDDFSPDSDIDVLVSYHSTAKRGLFEKIRMQEELSSLLQGASHLCGPHPKSLSQSGRGTCKSGSPSPHLGEGVGG